MHIEFAALLLTAGHCHAALVTNLDDLNYWGSGPNRAGFVVYWNDSKTPDALARGYRWTGTQTVADMMLFLAANDPMLFMRIDSATPFGPALYGIGYQTGAQLTAGNPVTPVFISGVEDMNTNPSAFESPLSSAATTPANAATATARAGSTTATGNSSPPAPATAPFRPATPCRPPGPPPSSAPACCSSTIPGPPTAWPTPTSPPTRPPPTSTPPSRNRHCQPCC